MADEEDTKPPAKEEEGKAQDEENDVESKTSLHIDGTDIANLLHSQGPIVKCVVLKAPKHDLKPSADNIPQLEDLMEELEIDTTPQKNQVEKILGGPITFVGQYDEGEGIVLMALRGLVEEDDAPRNFREMKLGQLTAQCHEWDINMEGMVERQDLIDALIEKEQALPCVNPHKLQPPLDQKRVRGDILILKVAEIDDHSVPEEEEGGGVKEEEGDADKQGEGKDKQEAAPAAAASAEPDADNTPPDSGEFFLSYTKAEYLKFAARTDIVAPPPKSSPEEEEAGNQDDGDGAEDNNSPDDENDEEFRPWEEEELTEEEEKSAMLNIVMSELLRKFREDNGRGANSQEVLEIRASVAEQIGMDVLTHEDAEQLVSGKKRAAAAAESPARKRVKFHANTEGGEEEEEEEDRKPAAVEDRKEGAVSDEEEDQKPAATSTTADQQSTPSVASKPS